jgi:flagellar biosynthesis/type III secretory pathway M-ring protein FliF/YscJ
MERLRQVFATITAAMGRLTLTHRMLIGAIMLIGVMGLVLVASYAGRTSMVEVWPGASAEDQARALEYVQTAGITYRSEGGRVLVPTDKRYEVMAMLRQAGVAPENSQLVFASLAASQSWMNSRAQNDQNFILALQNELAAVISEFNGVKSATVLIDAPEPVGMGMAFRRPTASVSVTMQSGRSLDRNMVDAIAAMVAGARAGMQATDVKVIDASSGRQFTARSPEDFRAGDYMEQVAGYEERMQSKIAEALAYIPGVIVAVSAQIDNRKVVSTSTTMMPTGQGSVAIVSGETEKSENNTTGGGPAEPGLRSNVGDDINRGSQGGGTRNTKTDTDTKFTVGLGSKKEDTVDPRGQPTKVSVMISLSREYIQRLIKQAAPADQAEAEVTQQQIDDQFAKEKARLEKDLAPLLAAAAQDRSGALNTGPAVPSVTVSMIPVPLGLRLSGEGGGGLLVAGAGGGAGAGMSIVNEIIGGSLGRTIVVGVLALVALGMMMMLVRRSGKPLDLPTAESIVGLPPALEPNSDVVGEADESQTAMEGIELDEGELKTKKMLEQVGEFVKKSPTDASALLNRWIAIEE